MTTLYHDIISRLPYSKPFLFVDEISHIDAGSVAGKFYLNPELSFYRGHFPGKPVTPGVILTEIMAQIGLVCLGIFLMEDHRQQAFPFALTATEVEFLKPVLPGETVTVRSSKIYFRFGKLKCKVSLHKENGDIACEGTLAGILIQQDHESA